MMFAGTAENYARYRPGVPLQASETLLRYVSSREVLLDVGSGTGMVIEALGPHFTRSIGVEPDPSMIEVATERLATAGLSDSTRIWHGAAEGMPLPDWPAPDLVTACRSFHWMDQERVLEILNRSMRPGSAIAIMGDGSLWREDLDWTRAMLELIKNYLGPRRLAGPGKAFSHHNKPYREMLVEVGLRDVEVVQHSFERSWSPKAVLGYLYSTSFASASLFGERLTEFETEASSLLEAYSARAELVEPACFELVLGRQP